MESGQGEQQASLSELRDALKDTLESRGVLGKIKAKIRSEIFHAIEDKNVPKPALTNENLLINELIREYMEYNHYRHSLSVFLPETGQPDEKAFDKSFIAEELNVTPSLGQSNIPMLYSLISALKSERPLSSPKKSPQKRSPQLNPRTDTPVNQNNRPSPTNRSSNFTLNGNNQPN